MLGVTKSGAKDLEQYLLNPSEKTFSVLKHCNSITCHNTTVINEVFSAGSIAAQEAKLLKVLKTNDVLQYPIQKSSLMDFLFSNYEQLLTCLYEVILRSLPVTVQSALSNNSITSQVNYKGSVNTVRLHIKNELNKQYKKTKDKDCKTFNNLLYDCYLFRNSIIHNYYPSSYCRYIFICVFLSRVYELLNTTYLKKLLNDKEVLDSLRNFK